MKREEDKCKKCQTQLSRKIIEDIVGIIEYRWCCRTCHKEYGESWKSYTSWRDGWKNDPETKLTENDFAPPHQKSNLKPVIEYCSHALRAIYFVWRMFWES